MQKPSIGRVVLVRLIKPSNGSYIHPAIINRVWSNECVNLCVLPDCGAPFNATSVRICAEFPPQLPEAPSIVAIWPPRE